ncbi:SH3 domain-containing protein [Bacillus sp. FJAT-49736]|uniref:SH3 domain-containing protein n=1 Tax=Bacillus sp. FJAT-49736 TaxID=2833582 RepID=UPI001BC99F49|nr:SH3 domain-containing protein [Bacillus sp. FJAT-49736]MBS4174221.1 SH3 domain-containing protein [Bacillus sp. FJAT-49736]
MKNKAFQVLISFFLTIIVFAPLHETSAATKTGVVDMESGVLNVRSGPGIHYPKVGSLKYKEKVAVYSVKRGWVQIKYGHTKGYVSDKYLRIYTPISATEAKKITDKAMLMERKTWEENYTKSQIYSIMAPGFTKTYIDKYFKQQFRTAGKDRKGNQLYHIIETEIWGLALYPMDWKPEYEPKKPTVTHYFKSGKEYLYVSQYHLNEETGNKTTTICFIKKGSKWLLFDHQVKYSP